MNPRSRASISGLLFAMGIPMVLSSEGCEASTGSLAASQPARVEVAAPVCEEILQAFGVRSEDGTPHEGVDIYARPGQPVFAIADGIVWDETPDRDLGTTISVYYPSLEMVGVFGHVQGEPHGDRISRGQVVGRVFKARVDMWITHLHFELEGKKMAKMNPLMITYSCGGDAEIPERPRWPVACRCPH